MSLMQRPEENPTTPDPSGTDSPKRFGIRERLTDAARASGRPDLVDAIAAADTPPWCSALFPEFGNLFELLNRGGYDHFVSSYDVAGRRLFSIAATKHGHRNQFVVLTEHDLTNPIILGAVLLAAGTDEFDGAMSREDAIGVLAELDDRAIPAPQGGLVETVVLPEPEVPFPALTEQPAWRAAVTEWAQDPENFALTSVAEVKRRRDEEKDLAARLTVLFHAVGRPELADILPQTDPVHRQPITPERVGLGALVDMLNSSGYEHTLDLWDAGDHSWDVLTARRSDSNREYVVLTEHDLMDPDLVGLVLLAVGPDEPDGVITRDAALSMLARMSPGIPAPQLGVIEVERDEPATHLDPPNWREVTKRWNTIQAVDDALAVVKKRAQVGVYEDGRPAYLFVVDENVDLSQTPSWFRNSSTGGGKSRAALIADALAASMSGKVIVRDPQGDGASATWTGASTKTVEPPSTWVRPDGEEWAWREAAEPGGDVESPHGLIPGCLRGTCAHSRMAHDVWDEQDPIPLCNAPGCGCGKLTPELIRQYPEYYIAGPGREQASQTNCRHLYFLTDSCPGCDADQEREELIESNQYTPAEWIAKFAADIHRTRPLAGGDNLITVADVVHYAPPKYQAAVRKFYADMWWNLRRPFPQPPEHVCAPSTSCGCCPGCGDGCGDCEGHVPCSPGAVTCVMPRGHEGDCVPPLTTRLNAHRDTLAVGPDGALL